MKTYPATYCPSSNNVTTGISRQISTSVTFKVSTYILPGIVFALVDVHMMDVRFMTLLYYSFKLKNNK